MLSAYSRARQPHATNSGPKKLSKLVGGGDQLSGEPNSQLFLAFLNLFHIHLAPVINN